MEARRNPGNENFEVTIHDKPDVEGKAKTDKR